MKIFKFVHMTYVDFDKFLVCFSVLTQKVTMCEMLSPARFVVLPTSSAKYRDEQDQRITKVC